MTATYWFLDLINCNAFEFVRPIAENISDFIRLFYYEDIEIGGVYIDGSLLLFDILALITVFLITKAKYYVYRGIECCERAIKICMQKYEDNFNKELQLEVEEKIKQCNNVAVLIQFEIKNMIVDIERDDMLGAKEDDACKIFYSAIKSLAGCKFAKTGNKMLILMDSYSRVDNLINFIEMSINRIRINMKNDNWLLTSYVAVDVYNANEDFKRKVQPILNGLISLRHKNEILCLGNFKLRYEFNRSKMYSFETKGPHKIIDECDVFSLVKKD
jgi:hypothetical protein